MNNPDLKKLISEYLAEARVMQLATVKDGQPWICTVNYVYDENFNIYWMSLKTTRHSRELQHHPQVAGVIVRPYGKKMLTLFWRG